MGTDQCDLAKELHARRAALERLADAAQLVGNQQSLEMTKLLIRQCDFLIERAERRASGTERHKCEPDR
jgi:hypothetical protein